MTNIEKCKAALAQGLRVQMLCIGEDDAQWEQRLGLVFTGADCDYRIHPDDEAKFVEPGASPAKHTSLSTRTINGRTYTHRVGEYLCRVVCTDYLAGDADVVAVALDPEDGREFVCTVTLKNLTPGTDPAFDVDWSKVAIDAPIWVRETDADEWLPRHFAGTRVGYVQAWDDGLTSHTSASGLSNWVQARLTKPE